MLNVDVAEYFAAAKDVMKDIQDKAEESRPLLAKKMQVWPLIWKLIVGMRRFRREGQTEISCCIG
jgi:hypothetical protein